MCGLVGLATTEKSTSSKNRAGFLHQGLLDNMWRGWESTGVAVVRHGEETKVPEVYKDAICAFDFCRRPYMENVLANMERYTAVLGHCRSATRGFGLTAANAHPFQYGHITLTHNGTIENYHEIVPFQQRPKDITVDSDVVAYAMGQLKDSEDEEVILEKLKGAFCLVWYNNKNGTLNVARNDRKPLHFCYGIKENTMYYSSEYTSLVHLTERRGIGIEGKSGKLLHPKANVWYKFKLEDLRSFTSRPFVQHHRTRGSPLGTTEKTGTPATGGTEYKEPTKEELESIRKAMGEGGASSTRDGMVLPNINDDKVVKDFLRARRALTSNLKCSGLPSKASNVRSVDAELLKKFGLHFNQVQLFHPTEWHVNKNTQGKLGYMLGHSASGVPMLMHSVENERWLKYQAYKKVYVNCVNTIAMDNNEIYVVAIEHPTHQVHMDAFFREEAERTPGKKELVTSLCRGPDGRYITEEEFRRLSNKGCGYCDGFVNPLFAQLVIWIGDSGRTPICHVCTYNPEFWTYAGLNPSDFPQLKAN